MKVTQRAFAYISRKKGKTLSLFLVIFIVAIFLITCFGVLNASKKLTRVIRTSLGAAFYIRATTEMLMNENGEAEVKENHIHISQKEIDEIMQADEIKYYNPINYGFAKSDAIHFIPGDKDTAESNMGKVTALRYSALTPDFTDETAVLIKGKHIREADTRQILISEPLANANHISVGDQLTLTHAELGESNGAYIDKISVKTAYVPVHVSGIYRLNTSDTSVKPTAGIPENEIYASLDILNELHESETDLYTGEVAFYITDPAKLDNILRSVRALQSIDWTTHFIRTNDLQYSKIADRLSSLGALVKILLILVSVVSATVLTLLLTMRMRGRMQEAGILLAAGISKGEILAGFLLEILFISIIALIVSYVASFNVTKFWGYRLFHGLQPNLLNEKVLMSGTQSRISIENHLKLNGIETSLIYFCQLFVITISTFIASIMIMRLKPKEILSKFE